MSEANTQIADAEWAALAEEGARIDAELAPFFDSPEGQLFTLRQRAAMFKSFIEVLFSPYEPASGWANLRAIYKPKKQSQSFWLPLGAVQDEEERLQRLRGAWNWAERLNKKGWDIYAGVLPRETQEFGGKKSIKRAAWFWADMDFKVAGEDEAFSALAASLARPDMVVLTGNGIHPYWRLARQYDFAGVDGTNPDSFERKLGRFQESVLPGCDAVQNIDRIMRCPGYYNWRNQDDPRLAVLVLVPEDAWRKNSEEPREKSVNRAN